MTTDGRPSVSLVNVGGTIASEIDYETGAVTPQFSAERIYNTVPAVEEMADLRAISIANIQSENIRPHHWNELAEVIAEELNGGADGVVVPHGTDVMGHTAAALAFCLPELSKPVVLVGAQRSPDRPSSDVHLNLESAVAAATADFAEVGAVMHGTTGDEFCWLHPGTKVRKCHTSRRDAFQTVNTFPLARVEDGEVTFQEGASPARRTGDETVPDPGFEDDVALLKLVPNISGDRIERLVDDGYEGIVLEGTGLGHAPEQLDDGIRRATDAGIPVVMTSQCLWGRTNMRVYSRGRNLLDLGVIPAGDMLPGTAYVKLMWVLDRTDDPEEAAALMRRNLARELTDRTRPGTYATPGYRP